MRDPLPPCQHAHSLSTVSWLQRLLLWQQKGAHALATMHCGLHALHGASSARMGVG